MYDDMMMITKILDVAFQIWLTFEHVVDEVRLNSVR